MKILITIGHGAIEGSDRYNPGAVANGYEEFKLAKEIGKWAQAHLNNNYNVQCDLWNYNADMNLTQRINRLQDNTYAYVGEIHLNAGGGTGSEVYHYNTDSKGKAVATAICEKLCSAFGWRNRGAKLSNGNYGIVDRTTPTANLIEVCFIDKLDDVQKVATAEGQIKAGQMIGEGIAKALGLTAKNQGTMPTPIQPPVQPTPPQPKPQHLKGTVLIDALNMRTAPVTGNVIRVLKKGEYFTVLSASDGWFYIDFAGTRGYVAVDDNYVKVEDLNNGNKVIKYGTPITK